jgi:hypothetical protein
MHVLSLLSYHFMSYHFYHFCPLTSRTAITTIIRLKLNRTRKTRIAEPRDLLPPNPDRFRQDIPTL